MEVGYTTVGWRYFDNGGVQYADGLMDTGLGVRYQIFNEAMSSSPWTPTLTFRPGVVLPGTYEQAFVCATGNRSVGVEPELLARKHFGWPGLVAGRLRGYSDQRKAALTGDIPRILFGLHPEPGQYC